MKQVLPILCFGLSACLPVQHFGAPSVPSNVPGTEVRYIEVPTGPVAPPKIVEVPAPVPTADLTPIPLPQVSAQRPRKNLRDAKAASFYDDARGQFVQGKQIYPFFDGASYKILAAPLRIVDVRLQPGEQILAASAGDTINWRLEPTLSGFGDNQTVHLLIKPINEEADTNLIVTTDRRTYNLELRVSQAGDPFHNSVTWTYPDDDRQSLHDRITALHTTGRTESVTAGGAVGSEPGRYTVLGSPSSSIDEAVANLNFNWTIEGATDQPWLPTEIYDDGARVILRFRPEMARRQMPVLSLLTSNNQIEIVNYIQNGSAIIVPYMFDRALLYMSPDDRVVITRTGVWTHNARGSR